MDHYDFFRHGGPCPTDGQLLDTKLFYRYAVQVYSRFPEWEDNDRFYFIPLFQRMTYSCAGWVAEIAPDPVWLGSFVRCTLDHPDLFQYRCPDCGETVHPFRYVGSPLSGRVDLEGRCRCGWEGYESVSGWFPRATVLRDQLAADAPRSRRFGILHPGSSPATVEELLRMLGIE